MSADEELGYVYLPISTPTNDFYGGHRRATASMATASSVSRQLVARRSGTTSSSAMDYGTMTRRRHPTSSTSSLMDAEWKPSLKSPNRPLFMSSTGSRAL